MEPLKSPENLESELEALRESERRFRAIYEQAPIGMTLVDIHTGRFVKYNAKFREITGRTPEELAGLDVMRLTYPGDAKWNQECLDQLRRGETRSFTIEKRYVRPNGALVWISATAVAMWAEGSEPDYYMALTEDISERKATEAERQRQATFDRLITEILGRFAYCTGAEIDMEIQDSLRIVGSFIGSEEAFVSLLSPDLGSWSVRYGWPEPGGEDLSKPVNLPLGQHPWVEQRIFSGEGVQIAGPDDWPPEAAAERAFGDKLGWKALLLLPLRGRGGQVRGAVGLRTLHHLMEWTEEDVRRFRMVADAIANVLERKRIEAALYDSRRMLQQILDTIPHRVFWKDLSFAFLGCNAAFAADVGLGSISDIVGKTDLQLFAPEDAERYRADDLGVIASGEPKIGYEEKGKRADGSVMWLRTSKVPLRDGNNRVFGVLGVAEDISDTRQARLDIEAAKEAAIAANQAKDQFIAVLSHELRTPLTPVLAMVTALEESEHLPERWKSDFETIHRNVELEARLIDDLLDVTRISQGKLILKPEFVDTHSCLRTALQICVAELEAKRQKLTLKLEAPRHFVEADPARIRQVFWNLIKNAVKFTPQGGRIEIRSSNEGERLKIVVADTGIGIEPGVLPRVFNAFEQGEASRERRFGGLGLGLSIAKALVEMHHGTLTASSEGRGKGATFCLELATVAEQPKNVAPAPLCQPENGQFRRILLVEDHEDTLRILTRLLRKWGYSVMTAETVKTALERASEGRFDLLISDLGLPDGSGLDIMRQLGKQQPAIALSGYGTDEDIQASIEAGFSEHLIKPVSFQALRATVENLLPAPLPGGG